jgi:geranylgeranyl diphosphate synthase, type III
MLHTASLLLDDIEDNSELRRGIPVAHRIYGVPSTINSANYMMFLAMSKTNKLGSAEATAAFLDEMIKLHEGQGFDILWRDMLHCPLEEEYRAMVLDKTGG